MLKMSVSLFTTVAISLALVVPASAQSTEEMSRDAQFWWPETLNLAPLRANDDRSRVDDCSSGCYFLHDTAGTGDGVWPVHLSYYEKFYAQ